MKVEMEVLFSNSTAAKTHKNKSQMGTLVLILKGKCNLFFIHSIEDYFTDNQWRIFAILLCHVINKIANPEFLINF